MVDRNEVLEELKQVVTGKTIDAIIPPLLFVLVNNFAGLNPALFTALGSAIILGLIRLSKKQSWLYALGGLLGVALAAALAYITQTATSYFVPALLSSALLFTVTLFSLFAGKPLAAWASHLTRGWPLAWFWRADVKPAYREVTWLWAAMLATRLILQVYLFRQGAAFTLAWVNLLLGWPAIIIVLVFTYIYGIWRLRILKGPGVEEFKLGKKPPWRGQTRGF